MSGPRGIQTLIVAARRGAAKPEGDGRVQRESARRVWTPLYLSAGFGAGAALAGAGTLGSLHPGATASRGQLQRSATGTPARADSMCCPQPGQHAQHKQREVDKPRVTKARCLCSPVCLFVAQPLTCPGWLIALGALNTTAHDGRREERERAGAEGRANLRSSTVKSSEYEAIGILFRPPRLSLLNRLLCAELVLVAAHSFAVAVCALAVSSPCFCFFLKSAATAVSEAQGYSAAVKKHEAAIERRERAARGRGGYGENARGGNERKAARAKAENGERLRRRRRNLGLRVHLLSCGLRRLSGGRLRVLLHCAPACVARAGATIGDGNAGESRFDVHAAACAQREESKQTKREHQSCATNAAHKHALCCPSYALSLCALLCCAS